MSRKPLLIAALAALLALMLLGAGCGGDDDESSNEAAPAAAATTEPEDESSSGDSAESCREFQNAASEISKTFASATTGTGNANLEEAASAFDELTDKAPSEVKADFETINEAFSTLAEALEGVDLTSGQAPDPQTLAKLQKALSSIDQAEVNAASARISTWAQKNCGA